MGQEPRAAIRTADVAARRPAVGKLDLG